MERANRGGVLARQLVVPPQEEEAVVHSGARQFQQLPRVPQHPGDLDWRHPRSTGREPADVACARVAQREPRLQPISARRLRAHGRLFRVLKRHGSDAQRISDAGCPRQSCFVAGGRLPPLVRRLRRWG